MLLCVRKRHTRQTLKHSSSDGLSVDSIRWGHEALPRFAAQPAKPGDASSILCRSLAAFLICPGWPVAPCTNSGPWEVGGCCELGRSPGPRSPPCREMFVLQCKSPRTICPFLNASAKPNGFSFSARDVRAAQPTCSLRHGTKQRVPFHV